MPELVREIILSNIDQGRIMFKVKIGASLLDFISSNLKWFDLQAKFRP